MFGVFDMILDVAKVGSACCKTTEKKGKFPCGMDRVRVSQICVPICTIQHCKHWWTYPGIVNTLFSPSVMSITPSSQPKSTPSSESVSLMACGSLRTLDDSASTNHSLEVAAVLGTVESAPVC
jgi:hypothetical protein